MISGAGVTIIAIYRGVMAQAIIADVIRANVKVIANNGSVYAAVGSALVSGAGIVIITVVNRVLAQSVYAEITCAWVKVITVNR